MMDMLEDDPDLADEPDAGYLPSQGVGSMLTTTTVKVRMHASPGYRGEGICVWTGLPLPLL